MKLTTGLFATAVGVVAAAALVASPAQAAAPTFTVSPGGAWSGTRATDSTVGIRDAVSNQTTLCSGLAVAGSFRSGSGLSGTGIGTLTSVGFTGCQAEGVAVTVTVHTSATNPAPIHLTALAPNDPAVATGQATNVSLTLDDANGCHAVVGAQTGGGAGFTGVPYRSTDHRFSFAANGKGPFVQSATAQCDDAAGGLDVRQGDRISLGGSGNSIVD